MPLPELPPRLSKGQARTYVSYQLNALAYRLDRLAEGWRWLHPAWIDLYEAVRLGQILEAETIDRGAVRRTEAKARRAERPLKQFTPWVNTSPEAHEKIRDNARERARRKKAERLEIVGIQYAIEVQQRLKNKRST